MSFPQIIVAYSISNIAALLFLATTVYSNRLARILFSALFIGAGILNWIVIHTNPADYFNYSKYAVGLYRDIIVGPFHNHLVLIISCVAACQVVIGLGLLYKNHFLRFSCITGSIFLVAISPLGIATAFPSGLIWALGLFVIYRYPSGNNVLITKWSF